MKYMKNQYQLNIFGDL